MYDNPNRSDSKLLENRNFQQTPLIEENLFYNRSVHATYN